MDLLTLNLFPEGALDSSVITTVWIGVFVVAMFNLRFGWVLSGLVVPGYLVPLLIARPISAGVVLLEAVLTYLIVITLAGPLARMQGWGSFFGRDRFFALILVSVIVRLVMDGWLLPVFGEWFTTTWDVPFDYRNNLHSFGLIIIALIANQFWKTGLARGTIPLLVTVGLTFIIVRFGLMEFTNFRVSGISYMFEDVTSSILASPKAYIILLTTAFVASRMNLFYGWEFNGILIPSLIALQWFEPTKILISFAEAFLILGIGTLLLRVPIFANANIEGARKLLLFFNISFAWKILLGYFMVAFLPNLKVSDYFAFGYLLSTLMAIKMHDKSITLRLTWSTLTTSLVSIFIASVIGFSLTLLPTGVAGPSMASVARAETGSTDQSLINLLTEEKRRLYSVIGSWKGPLPAEMETFREAVSLLHEANSVDDPAVNDAAQLLAAIDYEVLKVDDRMLLLREAGEANGWGTYVVNTTGVKGALIDVPGPLHETGSLEAGLWLFNETRAGGLAIGGSRRNFELDKPIGLLNDRQALFHVFHDVFNNNNVTQVRGYRPSLRRMITLDRDAVDAPAIAYIKGAVPPSLNLGVVRERIGQLEVRFAEPPEGNDMRDRARVGFAELLLDRPALRRMAAGLRERTFVSQEEEGDQSIEGYLEEWLLDQPGRIAARGSDQYVPPDLYELLFFDEEILTPLLESLDSEYRAGRWSEVGLEALAGITLRAAEYGYRLFRYRHRASGNDYLILGGDDSVPSPYWGTYVFRAGISDPYVVQVPRPGYERNSFQFGVHLFERLNGRALLIAGAHPYANRDGSSDVTRISNRQNLFNLVNQVITRESDKSPLVVVQARTLGLGSDRPVVDEDIVFSSARGIVPESSLDPATRVVLETLRGDGLSITFTDGSRETSGLEASGVYQSLYQRASPNKSFALLWLSPLSRISFGDQFDNNSLLRDVSDVGVEVVEDSLLRWLGEQPKASELDREAMSLADRYVEFGDVVALWRLKSSSPVLIRDFESRQAYLVLRHNGKVSSVASVSPLNAEQIIYTPSSLRASVEAFRNTRSAWLIMTGEAQ